MTSDEGLNAYGAVTWGQFFIYQGFNERAGWMHTSSGVDAVDEYLETVEKKGDGYVYKYGNEERPVTAKEITVPYKTAHRHGGEEVHRLPHAPRPDHPRGERQVGHHPADAGADQGADAVVHAHQGDATTRPTARRWSCRPTRRTTRSSPTPTATSPTSTATSSRGATRSFDWTKPVDGSNPATEWQGLLSVDETPHLLNPQERLAVQHEQLAVVGGRPEQSEEGGLSRVRGDRRRIGARPARDSRAAEQEGFHARLADRRGVRQLSHLVREAAARADQGVGRRCRRQSAEGQDSPAQIELLRNWDLRWARRRPCRLRSRCSGARTSGGAPAADAGRGNVVDDTHREPARRAAAAKRWPRHPTSSQADFGTWKTPWGDINRFQRLTGDIVQPFNDAEPSIPVGFTSSRVGLAGVVRRARRIRARRNGTAPAATASSPWWSSATPCARGP